MLEWKLNQQNRICFVMVDAAGTEVAGLGGAGLTLQLSKNGAAFVASAGTKAEISDGWYTYLSTAAESDSVGVIAIKVTGAGCVQQNLEYTVQQRNPNAIAFTYTVTDTSTSNPIEGVEVIITTDIAGSSVIWAGDTDALGVARDDQGRLPYLDPGTYYFWSQRSGYSFSNPDSEVVS
jgi:hypothetical protein